MEQQYNMKSPAVKRLMQEAKELCEPTEEYFAQPVEDNLFEWHFTVRGPPETQFEGGIYHGRIILPPEYPMKPPSIIVLTPNGRFEVNKKICLSISGHHPESWQPSWSIRTALLAIIGFMPTQGMGAIGSLDYTPEERHILAKKSLVWNCAVCGPVHLLLREPGLWPRGVNEEAKSLAQQISFKGENDQLQRDNQKLFTEATAIKPEEDVGQHVETQFHINGVVRHRCNNGQSAQLQEMGSQRSSVSNAASLSSYLIILLLLAIIALIFRRLFIL